MGGNFSYLRKLHATQYPNEVHLVAVGENVVQSEGRMLLRLAGRTHHCVLEVLVRVRQPVGRRRRLVGRYFNHHYEAVQGFAKLLLKFTGGGGRQTLFETTSIGVSLVSG